LLAFDKPLFYLINKNCANRIFDVIMPVITEIGDWKTLLVLAMFLLFLKKKEIKITGVYIIAGLFLSSAAAYMLKMMIASPRPFGVLPDVRLLVKGGEKTFSFPSRHAINIFMAATVLYAYSKKLYYMYFIAIAVIFSRVYVGMHFPSDVLAGAAIGMLIGYGITRVKIR